MPDVDERLIKFQSAEFRRATEAQVSAPGPRRAAATIRGRVRLRTAAYAALVVVLLAVAGGGLWYASTHPIATVSASRPSASAAPSASAPAALAPSVTASPSPSVSLPPLDANQLRMSVPAWPATAAAGCPSGLTTFTDYRADGADGGADGKPLVIQRMVDMDLDHDGSSERIFLFRCDATNAGPAQVVAYHASASRDYELFGTVAQTGAAGDPTKPGTVQDIQTLTANSDGTVALTVADRPTVTPPEQAVVQVRTFSWTGATFQQTSGPTTFQADASQSGVHLAVEADSQSVRIRISNDGPGAAALVVFVQVPANPPAGGDWSRCEAYHTVPGGDSWTRCAVSLRAGVAATLTLPVTAKGANPTARVQVRTGDNHFLYAEQTVPLATS